MQLFISFTRDYFLIRPFCKISLKKFQGKMPEILKYQRKIFILKLVFFLSVLHECGSNVCFLSGCM